MAVLQQVWLYEIIGGTLPMCQNITMPVNWAWIKRYCVFCSKTYNTWHSCHNFPAGSREATRIARIYETSLLWGHIFFCRKCYQTLLIYHLTSIGVRVRKREVRVRKKNQHRKTKKTVALICNKCYSLTKSCLCTLYTLYIYLYIYMYIYITLKTKDHQPTNNVLTVTLQIAMP